MEKKETGIVKQCHQKCELSTEMVSCLVARTPFFSTVEKKETTKIIKSFFFHSGKKRNNKNHKKRLYVVLCCRTLMIIVQWRVFLWISATNVIKVCFIIFPYFHSFTKGIDDNVVLLSLEEGFLYLLVLRSFLTTKKEPAWSRKIFQLQASTTSNGSSRLESLSKKNEPILFLLHHLVPNMY